MKRGIVVLALLLPICGCVVQPAPVGYAPAPYGYGGPVSAPVEVYPGYSYNNGAPTLLVEGAVLPLIYFGGGWGYYDRYHHFFRAPGPVAAHLESHFPRGAGFRGGFGVRGGGFAGRPGGFAGRGGFARPVGGFRQGAARASGGQRQHRWH